MAFMLSNTMGMPAGMAQLLQEKYRQSGMVAAAQANQANAAANLQNQNARQVAPLAAAQIREQASTTRLNNENADMVKPIGFSNIKVNESIANKNNADALFTDKQRSRYDDRTNAEIYQGTAAGDLNRANSIALGATTAFSPVPIGAGTYKPFTPYSDSIGSGLNFGLIGGGSTAPVAATSIAPVNIAPVIQSRGSSDFDLGTDFYDKTKSLLSGFSDSPSFRLKRGIARVPGKGEGDKVPSLLEPNEAVLNKHAADLIGRDKIAKANAKGNDLRKKQDALRIAQMLKAMSSGMV